MENTNDKSRSTVCYYYEINTNVEVSTVDKDNGTTSTIGIITPSGRYTIEDIDDLDIKHGFTPFVSNCGKRYLIGVRGEYNNIVFFINIDNMVYEEFIFINAEQLTIGGASGFNDKEAIVKANFKLIIDEDENTSKYAEVMFLYSSLGINVYNWTDMAIRLKYSSRLNVLKIDRRTLTFVHNNTNAQVESDDGNTLANDIEYIKDAHELMDQFCDRIMEGAGPFALFNRTERCALAPHIDFIAKMLGNKLRELAATAEK